MPEFDEEAILHNSFNEIYNNPNSSYVEIDEEQDFEGIVSYENLSQKEHKISSVYSTTSKTKKLRFIIKHGISEKYEIFPKNINDENALIPPCPAYLSQNIKQPPELIGSSF